GERLQHGVVEFAAARLGDERLGRDRARAVRGAPVERDGAARQFRSRPAGPGTVSPRGDREGGTVSPGLSAGVRADPQRRYHLARRSPPEDRMTTRRELLAMAAAFPVFAMPASAGQGGASAARTPQLGPPPTPQQVANRQGFFVSMHEASSERFDFPAAMQG